MEADDEYLGEFLSLYLGKGSFWSRRVFGVYATKNRIIGMQFGWEWSLIISWTPLIAAIGFAIGTNVAIYSIIDMAGLSFWPLLSFVSFLGLIVTTSSASIIDMKLKHRRPLAIEEVQLKQYFDARRDQISHIVMQRGTALSPGSLTITLRAGTFIHISIFNSFRNSGKRFDQLKQLIESFCMKPFEIRPPNLFVWTL